MKRQKQSTLIGFFSAPKMAKNVSEKYCSAEIAVLSNEQALINQELSSVSSKSTATIDVELPTEETGYTPETSHESSTAANVLTVTASIEAAIDSQQCDTANEDKSTSEWPIDWNEKQIDEFSKKYKWLSGKNGKLGCSSCFKMMSLGGLGMSKRQGFFISNEWANYQICASSEKDDRYLRLLSLRKKIKRHLSSDAHVEAEKILEQQKKQVLPNVIAKQASFVDDETRRIFRTVYYQAKSNRPFSDLTELVKLQRLNGLKMGKILHSRYSAKEIVNVIAEEMTKKIVTSLVTSNSKLSVLIDESTTASSKTALVVTLRASVLPSEAPVYIFLELIELQSQTAEAITNALLKCLSSHGFTKEYLKAN